ncbi:GNVR domain-containing protein [Candidatus Amarolinea dominans]|uniref:GNVR domain-containing protein n=1 Tax=Candidatus Amarolinea dominans TaxID=3140696 RepID=UPI003136014F|nr:hypothetical protein [Anaerolineae bacterium]
MQTKITELEAIQNRAAAQDADLSRFQDSLQQYRNSYANLVKSFEDLRLNEARATDTISTVEPAEVPKKPVRPRVLLNTVLGLLVGMVLAIGGVLLIEYLDDTLEEPGRRCPGAQAVHPGRHSGARQRKWRRRC